MDIGDEYVVRTLPNKRLYTRYCSCSCWYEAQYEKAGDLRI